MVGMMALASAIAIPFVILYFVYRYVKNEIFWRKQWEIWRKRDAGEISYSEAYRKYDELCDRFGY